MAWTKDNSKYAKEQGAKAKDAATEAQYWATEAENALQDISGVAPDAIAASEYVEGKKPLIEKAIADSGEAKATAETVETQFNEIVAEAGSNNPEVVQARGGEVNLNARLTKVTQQLAETAAFNSPKLLNVNEKMTDVPIISFIDDDGEDAVYTRLVPIFESKGVGFGSAIITNYVDTNTSFMTLNQIKDARQRGMETLSHTVNHPNLALGGLSPHQIDEELKKSKQWLASKGFENESFVYPQSGQNSAVRKNTRIYYDYAFGGSGFNEKGYIDHSLIERIGFGSWTDSNPTVNGNSEKNTLAYYKACVDYAVSTKTWLVFMLHVAQQPLEQDVILGQLIDYINSLNVQILKPSEAFRVKANKLSVGDKDENHLFIGKDGIKSNMLTVWEKAAGRTSASPLTAFEPGRITVIEYISSYNGMFPATAGILETYHSVVTNTLSFQIFTATSKVVYKRHWNGAAWTAWETQNMVTLDMNSMTADLGRGSFPSNVVSMCQFQASAATGFPKNQGGTLITNKFYGSGYDYQTYKIYNTNELWTRYAINNTTWSEWVLLSPPEGYELFNVDMPEQTVNAGVAVDVIIDRSGVQVTDFITGNPLYGLPPGIMYSIMVLTNGQITVRLFNAGTTNRTITARPWRFNKAK